MTASPHPADGPINFDTQLAALETLRTILGETVYAEKRAELLAERDSYYAAQTGSGAIAQGAQIVVGKNNQQAARDIINQYGAETRASDEALRVAYLRWLRSEAGALPLDAIDRAAITQGAEPQLALDAVYTALLTKDQEASSKPGSRDWIGGQPLHLPALAQADRHARLVLLGDPGSGKSTFANYLALCLAGEALDDPRANLARLCAPLPKDDGSDGDEPQPWRHGALLPVRVMLRDFAVRGLATTTKPLGAATLWRFIQEELDRAALSEFSPLLKREMQERGAVVLLDGLDEVPEANERRTQLKAVIESFSSAYSNCRLLVTSRTYAYQNQAWRLPGFAEATLLPFTPGQIRRFVTGWYAHIAERRPGSSAEQAQGRAALLQVAIERRPRLRELAERPLLLTLMASLHAWRQGSLPERREQLYAEAVDLLLDRWEQRQINRNARGEIEQIEPSLSEWMHIEQKEVQAVLDWLAYGAHAGQHELTGTADIAESDLVMALLGLIRRDKKPADVRELRRYLSERAGLLIPRGVGVYTFPHRTFQEYLAARYLTDPRHGEGPNHPGEFPDNVAALARADPNRWREVALLAAAKAGAGTPSTLWGLVDVLSEAEPDDEGSEADLWGALLAGQVLVENPAALARLSERHERKLARVRGWLLRLMRGDTLPAIERAAAGRVLAALGDPRSEATTIEGMQFCRIPAGRFWMGSPDTDKGGAPDERPLHEVELPYGYWLARYPVTNAQYGAFVAAGGYADARYWPEAEAHGYWSQMGLKVLGDQEPRLELDDQGEPFNLPTHPVVGVSWYEALAFCRWLTAQARAIGWLTEDWQVVLPSEAEWEQGARGGQQLPAWATPTALGEGLASGGEAVVLSENPVALARYTWGKAPDPQQANYDESGIGSTSAVGCFAGGASPYGVEELIGNVWEWTRSLWGRGLGKPTFGYPYDHTDGRESLTSHNDARVVRGGCFTNSGRAARCAFRDHLHPEFRNRLRGFRVAIVPEPLASTSSDV